MNPDLSKAVWQILSEVPAGKVVTYGQLARLAGFPTYARQVGMILSNLPEDTTLPWHRVINSRGCISFPAGSAKYQKQKSLLEAEGVEIQNERISLNRYISSNLVV